MHSFYLKLYDCSILPDTKSREQDRASWSKSDLTTLWNIIRGFKPQKWWESIFVACLVLDQAALTGCYCRLCPATHIADLPRLAVKYDHCVDPWILKAFY